MSLQGLGTRLRTARTAANLTQGAVASVFGYVPETIANWERERTEPSASDLSKLATLYHVSLDWLTTGNARLPHRFECVERCPHGISITDRCTKCES